MLGARRGSGVWFNRRDSKSRVPSWHRGFESPPLRPAKSLSMTVRHARRSDERRNCPLPLGILMRITLV
jgi:hypothetical protein